MIATTGLWGASSLNCWLGCLQMFQAGVLCRPGSLLSSAVCCTAGQRWHLNGKVSTAWQVSEVFVKGEKEFSLLKIYVLQKITAPADCCSYWKHMVAVGRNIKCYSVVPVENMQELQMISIRPEISKWFMIPTVHSSGTKCTLLSYG